MNGYRKMIESRIPTTWVVALKHCRCYKRYVEHVYSLTAGRLNDDCMHTRAEKKRLKAVSIRAAFEAKHRVNRFAHTIDMDFIRLYKPEEIEFWERVTSWVAWFSLKTPYILNSSKILREVHHMQGKALAEEVHKLYKGVDRKIIVEILKGYGHI